jgi:hypothetical protein
MKSLRIAGVLSASAALAVPASAAAHGTVFTDEAKVAVPGNPVTTTDETQYLLTNHGFTMRLKESNNELDHGMIDYKVLPSAYRTQPGFTLTRLLDEGNTGAQPHATCHVGALETEDAIMAWQGEEPFYNYVPFQKQPAGLEDDPAKWIPVVNAELGVDLTTESNPAAACAAKGGEYREADATVTTAAALASGTVEQETAPLVAEIAGLKTAATDADKAKAALQALLDAAKAEIAKLTAAAAPMKVALPTARIADSKLAKKGTTVTVTGPVGKAVAVKLAIGESRARKMKLSSSALARGKATLGADGTAKVALKPGKSVAKRIGRLKRSASITVSAFAGDRVATTTATLTR